MQINDQTHLLTQLSTNDAQYKRMDSQMNTNKQVNLSQWLTAGLAIVMLMGMAGQAQAGSETRKIEYEYDSKGRLTKAVIEPDDLHLCLVMTYMYDDYGNRKEEATRNCVIGAESGSPAEASSAKIALRTTKTTYDDHGRFIEVIENAEGHKEKRSYNGDFGTLSSVIEQETSVDAQGNSDGLVTKWDYDSFGRQEKVTRPDDSTTTTTYTICTEGVNGCLKYSSGADAQYTVKVTQEGAPYIETAYDHLGRKLRIETIDVMGEKVYQDFYYDSLSRLTGETTFYHNALNAYWTTYAYDALNRVTKVKAPDDLETNYEYEGFTTKTKVKNDDQVERVTTKEVNSQGQVISITDPNLEVLEMEYDPFGNLVKTIAASTSTKSATTEMQYDKRGNKVAMNDPDNGVIIYEYDVLGNLKYQRDAKFQEVKFEYDKLDRMTKRVEPDLTSTWTYDDCDPSLNTNGKCEGRLVKETSDNNYERAYFYDDLGRLTHEHDNIDQDYYVVKKYDDYSRVSELTYPTELGFTLSTFNTYSSSGLLEKVEFQLSGDSSKYLTTGVPSTIMPDLANKQTGWEVKDTDEAGRISKVRYGNAVETTTIYDQQNGRIKSIKAFRPSSATTMFTESYGYDALGNLTSRVRWPYTSESFGYDKLNRVISAKVKKYNTEQLISEVTVAYDAIGNITSKSDVGSYSYESKDRNGNNRPHSVSKIVRNDGTTANYHYDENGNVTSIEHLQSNQARSGSRSFSLNSWDMPTEIAGDGFYTPIDTTASKFEFIYNSAHERVKEVLPDGTVVHNISPRIDAGIHLEKHTKPGGDIQYNNYLYAGDTPFGILALSKNGTEVDLTYLHQDRLGSITATTGPGVHSYYKEQRSYDAWGKRRNLDGTAKDLAFTQNSDISHSFTGHEDLAEIGLIHMNGRIYDPMIGRFMSADPLVQFPDFMQSYNRYAYISNNPFSGIDPSGYSVEEFELPMLHIYGDSDFSSAFNFADTLGAGFGVITTPGIGGSDPGQIFSGNDVQVVGLWDGLGKIIWNSISKSGKNAARKSGQEAADAAKNKLKKKTPKKDANQTKKVEETKEKEVAKGAEAIGTSKKGLKHIAKHTEEFKALDKSFTLEKQVDLGKQIAGNPKNLVNKVNGSKGYEAIVKIGESNVRVRAVVNSSGNLRSVYPIMKK